MPDTEPNQISDLLERWSEGDEAAVEKLVPLIYNELRKMARAHLRRRPSPNLQTSELIHEAYLKLAKNQGRGFRDRVHFYAVASTAMRHILVDHVRGQNALKRGGPREKVPLNNDIADDPTRSMQLIALDEALQTLAGLNLRKSRVVEFKFFGGMTNEETAEALGVSLDTVKSDWRFARAWLLREMDSGS